MGERRRAQARGGRPADSAPAGDPTAEALAPLRDRIDAIDHEIVALLNERAQIALEIGRVKQVTGRRTVRDAAREVQVLERVTSASAGLFPEPELVALYRKLIAATRRVQHAQKRAGQPDGGADTHDDPHPPAGAARPEAGGAARRGRGVARRPTAPGA